MAKGLRLMENRHLPILHKKIFSVSSVFRTSPITLGRVGGEHRLECKLFSALLNKYSFAYVVNHERVVGYDNYEHKGDHRHDRG